MSAETVINQIMKLSPDEKSKVHQFVLDEQIDQNGNSKNSRKPNLHPDAMTIASDFNAPLSDEFWIGKA